MMRFFGDDRSAGEFYRVKRAYLTCRFGDELKPMDFYRKLYPSGGFERPCRDGYDYDATPDTDRRPNGIITEIPAQPASSHA